MSLQQGFSGLPAQGARPGSWAWEKNVKQLQSCEIEGGAHVGRANPPTSAALRPSHQPTRKMRSSSKWHLIGSWDFSLPKEAWFFVWCGPHLHIEESRGAPRSTLTC